jgi:hypothetical protein
MQKTFLLAAVVHADPEKLTASGGVSPGTTPHLISARQSLQELLGKDPESELAQRISQLLEQEKLFYVVGRWPPNQSEPGFTGTGSTTGRQCRHCGKLDP